MLSAKLELLLLQRGELSYFATRLIDVWSSRALEMLVLARFRRLWDLCCDPDCTILVVNRQVVIENVCHFGPIRA